MAPSLELSQPPILTLPYEVLFDICLRLDRRGLLAVPQTCRALHDVMSNLQFWHTLRSILESRPGIQPPFFEEDDNKSLDDLRRYTLKIFRAHDAWLAPSRPEFRFRTVKSFYQWFKNEVLPGGRWLLGLDRHQVAIVDLDSGAHYSLFEAPHPGEATPLNTFQISFKEGVHSSFRVAFFNIVRREATKTLVYIYQVDYCIDRCPPFQATHLTTVWDIGSEGVRDSVEVSDRCIFQCYSRDESDEILQIRRLSADPSVSQKYVEHSVLEGARISNNYQCIARLLPHDRLAVIVLSVIKVYAIDDSSDKAFPDLHLLHRLRSEIHPYSVSRPFVGQGSTYLVGTCGRTARRVNISHDSTVPPTVEILGRFESRHGADRSSCQFSSLVAFSHDGPHMYGFEMGIYDLTSCPSGYRRLFSDFPHFKHNVGIAQIVGFDDNVGRLVMWCSNDPYMYHEAPSASSYFLVMDLV